MKTITINQTILKVVHKIILDALEYEKITGRKLGITGEVGEILACDKLKLKLLADPLSAGYDAEDDDGNRYQIKSKRIINNSGRVGTFAKHKFDCFVMILFGKKYQVTGIWKGSYKKIEPIIKRHQRRNPTVQEIKNIA